MRSHELQLCHTSSEATHLVPFFVYLLQTLTHQTYLLVCCLQSSVARVQHMMIDAPVDAQKVTFSFSH
jgi:hypothetical protein